MSDKLLHELSGAQWTPSMLDKQQVYLARMSRSLRMSVMPPSAASSRMTIRADTILDGNGRPMITGQVQHTLSPVGLRLMRELPEDQIGHRSRVETTFSNLCQTNELRRRVTRVRDASETLQSLAMPSDVSEAFHTSTLENLRRYLEFDADWISHYINEHKTSSVVSGVKWADLPDPHEDPSYWREFVEHHRAITDIRLDRPGQWFAPDFNIGGRARPEADAARNVTDYDFNSTRSRIVMFHPALSSAFAGVPKKKEFYRDCWKEAHDIVGMDEYINFPPVDGGSVYQKFSDAMADSSDFKCILGDDYNQVVAGQHIAKDGGNWEQSVGTIAGDMNTTALGTFSRLATVPSGIFETTLLDSTALLWTVKYMDDNKLDEIPGVMERQPEDEEVNFFLGLRYRDDPEFPRLQGLKLSVDRADKTQRLSPRKPTSLRSRYSTEQSLSWYNAYHGLTLRGESLLTPFAEVEPGDWMSPDRIRDRVILLED